MPPMAHVQANMMFSIITEPVRHANMNSAVMRINISERFVTDIEVGVILTNQR